MVSVYCKSVIQDELECIEIQHPLFSATIVLQGAQLISFKPRDKDEWLWLSENATYESGKPIRGGIPICWPWFGNAKDNPNSVQAYIATPNAPAHGFARNKPWVLETIDESESSVSLQFSLPESTSEHWYGSAKLALLFVFKQDSLCLELTTACVSGEVMLSQALHTYFPTSDIHQTFLDGFTNTRYYDALDNWQEKPQENAIWFNGETDRVYLSDATQNLNTPNRIYTVTSNTRSTVVWNPWVEKSKTLSQFADDAWQRMFCVETANAMDDCVQLSSGDSHTLKMAITCRNSD